MDRAEISDHSRSAADRTIFCLLPSVLPPFTAIPSPSSYSSLIAVVSAIVLYFFLSAYRQDDTFRNRMSAIQPLKYLTVNAVAKHTATVVFLHGLGDTGEGCLRSCDFFVYVVLKDSG